MDRGEVDTPHGHFSVGVLLFQDICVVLMVMVLQVMGGGAGGSALHVVKGLGVSIVAFAVIIAVVGFLIPKIFDHVVRLRNREVFILTILLVCLGTAWLTSRFGLSLAVGAFIAGIAISESEYTNQIVAEVIPFRDTFTSLFFISIGMLLDFRYFIHNVGQVLVLVLAIMGLKALVIIGVGTVLKYPLRLSIVVGLTLAQIGEFSFILIKMGQGYNLLGHDLYQSLLAATILSMAATPFVYQQSSKVAMKAGRYLVKGALHEGFEKTGPSNHVIIIGYGVNGQNLARVLKETGIQHLVLDVNIVQVRKAKGEGHSAFYGDASHPELLKKMSIDKAKMLVVAISDPISTRRIVKFSRELNPALSVLVRTRYVKEVEELYRLGADQVIPEEFETSVEIFARVLRDYRTPGNIIQNQIDLIRHEGYAMLRNPSLTSDRIASIANVLDASLMDTFYVERGCSVEGRALGELDIKRKTGTTVIAVIRKGTARSNPPGDFVIESGDILVLLGSHAELNGAFVVLKESCPT
jgi:CPA2 family monovalent cation:H+ antiporter-2